MAIDFPASPTVGQVYIFAGVTYTYTSQGVWLAGISTSAFAPIDSPLFTGDPKAPTPALSDNDTSLATTAFVKTAPRLGVTDGSNAAAGQVGEFIEATAIPNSGSGYWGPLGVSVWYNPQAITLSPGDWDISASGYFSGGASWWYYFGISNGNTGSPDTGNIWLVDGYATANGDAWLAVGPLRLNITVSATIYSWIYGGSNGYNLSGARLRARRVR